MELEHHLSGASRDSQRQILAPVAYDDSVMPSLRLARSSQTARRIGKILFILLVGTILVMTCAPWQQSISGTGSVLAYAPDERQQVLQAPIKGRIVSWGEGIHENAEVTAGQVIAEIRDLDEGYLARLDQQVLNSEQAVTAVRQQLLANHRALEQALLVVQSYAAQVAAYRTVKTETIAAQDAYIEMTNKKIQAEQQQLAEYEAALPQLEEEFKRTQTLELEGNVSLQKKQEVERKLSEARAKVSRAMAYVAAAQAELEAKLRERSAKIEKAQVDIDYAEGMLRKSESEVSKAESDIAKAEQELSKNEKELVEMQVKVARQQNQQVTAPIDGFLVQINANAGTAILKEGDPICTIVPRTSDRSVQVWLNGNDAPLVEPGRHVRLQFEGWPAVQFAGWPSVAVGTFGGTVASIDSTDDGMGRFRVLIRPDPTDQPWPEDRYLRQGVRANGWVLLDRVPLWYEVWRRLNGFPPVISDQGKSDSGSKTKVPKLPKN